MTEKSNLFFLSFQVHTFDPEGNSSDEKRSKKVKFHNFGIGHKSKAFEFLGIKNYSVRLKKDIFFINLSALSLKIVGTISGMLIKIIIIIILGISL